MQGIRRSCEEFLADQLRREIEGTVFANVHHLRVQGHATAIATIAVSFPADHSKAKWLLVRAECDGTVRHLFTKVMVVCFDQTSARGVLGATEVREQAEESIHGRTLLMLAHA